MKDPHVSRTCIPCGGQGFYKEQMTSGGSHAEASLALSFSALGSLGRVWFVLLKDHLKDQLDIIQPYLN